MLGPLGYLFASLDQYTVGVVHEDCRVIAQVFNRAKRDTCCLNCCGCGGHPARSLIEKATGVRVGKGDWLYTCLTKLFKNGLIVDDFKECFVWESLFVIADSCGSVYSGKDCGLTRRALRTAFYSQSGISRYNNSTQKRLRLLILKHCERDCVQVVEGIVGTSCADSQTINEEKQYRRLSRHEASHVRGRDLVCCEGFSNLCRAILLRGSCCSSSFAECA